MTDTPDLEQLRAFAVFAEHLNFTHAARELGLSQPALHTRIKRLGEELEVALYRRRGRALVLTEAGERTAAFARELDARMRAFGDSLREEQERAAIVLASGEGALLYLLGPALRRFLRRHALQLLVGDAEATVEAVASGRAAIGVASLDEAPAALEAEPIAELGFALAVPSKDPLAERARVSWPELAGRALIVPPAGRPHRAALDANLPADAEIAVEAQGWPLTLQLVALGVGVAVVNEFCRPPRGVSLVPFVGLASRTYFALREPARRVVDGRAELLWTRLVG